MTKMVSITLLLLTCLGYLFTSASVFLLRGMERYFWWPDRANSPSGDKHPNNYTVSEAASFSTIVKRCHTDWRLSWVSGASKGQDWLQCRDFRNLIVVGSSDKEEAPGARLTPTTQHPEGIHSPRTGLTTHSFIHSYNRYVWSTRHVASVRSEALRLQQGTKKPKSSFIMELRAEHRQ